MALIERESLAKRSQDMTDIDFSVDTCNPNRQTVPEFSESSEEAESSSDESSSEVSDSDQSASNPMKCATVERSSGQVDQVADRLTSVTFLDQDEVYDL
jgi:hypothetical protein